MSRQKILNQSGEEKIGSLQSQMNLHAQENELDCLCYISGSITKALDGYFLKLSAHFG